MHGELGVGKQEIPHQRPAGVFSNLVAAVLHDQLPNPDGVEQAVLVQLPEGGGIFPQNIAVGAEILIYRPFRPGKQEVIHEIIFVVLDGGIHPFRQSGEQLPAVQLGTQARLDLAAVQQIPQTGQIVLLPQLAGVVDIGHPAVRKLHPVSAVGDVRAVGMGVFQKMAVHIRVYGIVAVSKADPFSRGRRHARKAGRGHAAVFLENRSDTPVPGGIVLHHLPGVVGGTVVHHNDFQL